MVSTDSGRWPITLGEWVEKVPGWDTHDIEGVVVAVRGGTLLLHASSVLALHALVCDHDEKADSDLIPAVTEQFDTVHAGRWERRCTYGVHWCIRTGTVWFSSERIDTLARMVAAHEGDA